MVENKKKAKSNFAVSDASTKKSLSSSKVLLYI